jgi:alkylation response protein AidB-like acyl-CoA dehydrogenase
MLFDAGWAVVSWAPEHGGRGASLWEWLLFEEEYYRAGAPPRITQNGIFLLAPSIYEFGTPEQQAGILPRMAAAQDLWCQGWSEPNAGSDLAGVASRARRVDGGWVLDGQKTWTTRGAFCTHLFGLFRSDPDSERHRGLTYLLVPLDTPGVTVRGFGRLDGDEGFAEVFFDEAFLADDAVPGGVLLGEEGGGWGVAMATAGSERGLTLRSPGRFLATAERLLGEVRARGGAVDPVVRRRAVEAWMKAEAYQLQTLQTVTRLAEGGKAGAEASLTKLWWSELDVELHEVALDLLGPDAELEGPWSKGWQFSLSGPIYAGTNEIQRNIAAERLPWDSPAGMRFAWTEDQVAFRDAVADLLARQCPPAVVRAAWEAPAGELDRGPWDALVAMGVRDVLVPEDRGGLGLDERSLVPVLSETGRAALPHPLIDTAMVAAPAGGGGVDGGLRPGRAAGALRRRRRRPAAARRRPARPGARRGRWRWNPPRPWTGLAGRRGSRRGRADATVVTDDPGAIDLAFDRGALGVSPPSWSAWPGPCSTSPSGT